MAATFSYLFDTSAPGVPSWFGGLFDPAFLTALQRADPCGQSHSWLLRGDLLIAHLGSRISNVKSDGERSSHTKSYDTAALATTTFDFLQWASKPPSRFDISVLQEALVSLHVAHCITAVSLSLEVAQAIDQALVGSPFYLGMAAVDLGNPIMVALLMDYLIKDAGVSAGRVWLEADTEGTVHSLFEGAAHFHPNGAGILPHGGLRGMFGSFPTVVLSADGQEAVRRHEQKSRLTLQERVLAQLAAGRDVKSHGPFHFEALKVGSLFEANVPPPKLTKYALNQNHPEGAGKAKFFNDVLAIGEGDWRYLMAQLREGIASAELTDISIKRWQDEYGVSFNAELAITGLNGRVANVFTNWIMEPDEEPRLSTIRPTEGDDRAGIDVSSLMLPGHLRDDERWETLFQIADRAGMAAHDAAVPTPLFFRGYGGYADGACGHAWVNLPDGRSSFARWLFKAGYGDKNYPRGLSIPCPGAGQSHDRAKAYAQAFAKVLEHNGVSCSIESRLD